MSRVSPFGFAFFLVVVFHGVEADATEIRVVAGSYDRMSTPVRCEVPNLDAAEVELVTVDTGRAVATQRDGAGGLVWIIEAPLAAGQERVYRLVSRKSSAGVTLADSDGQSLAFGTAGRHVLSYNFGLISPPENVDPVYARSGYIYPIRSPSGRIVANDFPENHVHHHGIWFPWTNTVFEGRTVDFWNQRKKQGQVECTGVDLSYDGTVFGGFRSRHRFIDLTAPDGPKEALKEKWDVKVYAVSQYYMADFRSVQECAGESPLLLKKYRYGGFGFRGSSEWEGLTGCEFLTSEGRTRADGHATRSRWCAIYGEVEGATVGITFFCHPNNFRAPQHMRIHPKEPFFNYAPCQEDDFSIVPGAQYESRYRFVVYDGKPDVAEMERLWRDYAHPPTVTVR